jgi:hypothetical protein
VDIFAVQEVRIDKSGNDEYAYLQNIMRPEYGYSLFANATSTVITAASYMEGTHSSTTASVGTTQQLQIVAVCSDYCP